MSDSCANFKTGPPRFVLPPAGKKAKKYTDQFHMAEKAKILVVEDEPSLRLLVRKVLERSGFEVLEAASGMSAMQLWDKDKPHIDLLLTDMVMPDGMSGRQLADRLKADNPGLKVLYTSGYSTELLGKDLALQEGTNFLQKPYPPSKLVQTVRTALGLD